MIVVPMEVSVSEVLIPMDVAETEVSVDVGVDYSVIMATPYEGEYEFTPSEQTQVIDMSGQRAKQNIIINPIPSNYGRVTWNGTSLTIE